MQITRDVCEYQLDNAGIARVALQVALKTQQTEAVLLFRAPSDFSWALVPRLDQGKSIIEVVPTGDC